MLIKQAHTSLHQQRNTNKGNHMESLSLAEMFRLMADDESKRYEMCKAARKAEICNGVNSYSSCAISAGCISRTANVLKNKGY